MMDRTLAQIAPRALEIIHSVGFDVQPGLTDNGSRAPNFRGLPDAFWDALIEHEDLWYEFLDLNRADFATFCALLLKVVSKGGGGTHAFIFNNSQRLIYNRMSGLIRNKKPLFLVILKARQLGITTYMSAWQYWQLWRQRDIQTLMIGHEVKLAERIIGIMRVFHDELPGSNRYWMPSNLGHIKPELRGETKAKTARIPRGELYMADRRSWGITAVAKNIDQRGFQGTHFSGSEAAFWPHLNDLMDALLPQLPTPGSPAYLQASVVLESSPNGQNEFYDKYQLALNPESQWEPIFLPWMVQDDEYVMIPPDGWRMTREEKQIQKRLSAERNAIDGKPVTREQMYYRHFMLLNNYDNAIEAWDQEYPSNERDCFMLNTNAMFKSSMRFLSECCADAELQATELWRSKGVKTNGPVRGDLIFEPLRTPFENHHYSKPKKPTFRTSNRGGLLVWEYPQEGHKYTGGGDASGGFEDGDPACVQIVCVTCHRQAAELAVNYGPEEFTDHFANLGTWYNMALLMPEVNGGYGGTVLKRLMQEWQYTNVAHEEKWDEVGIKKSKYGFSTQANTKPQLISYLRWMIEDRFLKISSRPLYRELTTFQYEQTDAGYETFKAKKGQHDDRVMALALALQAVKQTPKYAAILTGEQVAPSAGDLGLNKTPEIDRSDKLPPQLENLLGERVEEFMYANPIRGIGIFS